MTPRIGGRKPSKYQGCQPSGTPTNCRNSWQVKTGVRSASWIATDATGKSFGSSEPSLLLPSLITKVFGPTKTGPICASLLTMLCTGLMSPKRSQIWRGHADNGPRAHKSLITRKPPGGAEALPKGLPEAPQTEKDHGLLRPLMTPKIQMLLAMLQESQEQTSLLRRLRWKLILLTRILLRHQPVQSSALAICRTLSAIINGHLWIKVALAIAGGELRVTVIFSLRKGNSCPMKNAFMRPVFWGSKLFSMFASSMTDTNLLLRGEKRPSLIFVKKQWTSIRGFAASFCRLRLKFTAAVLLSGIKRMNLCTDLLLPLNGAGTECPGWLLTAQLSLCNVRGNTTVPCVPLTLVTAVTNKLRCPVTGCGRPRDLNLTGWEGLLPRVSSTPLPSLLLLGPCALLPAPPAGPPRDPPLPRALLVLRPLASLLAVLPGPLPRSLAVCPPACDPTLRLCTRCVPCALPPRRPALASPRLPPSTLVLGPCALEARKARKMSRRGPGWVPFCGLSPEEKLF